MHSFHIYRYDPDADEKPRMQVIELEVGSADRMLLATVGLYVSIFNLFTSLLSLFGFGGSDD